VPPVGLLCIMNTGLESKLGGLRVVNDWYFTRENLPVFDWLTSLLLVLRAELMSDQSDY